MVFTVLKYICESLTIKKAERRTIDAFQLWCWKRLLRVPWIARRSNQLIVKGINAEYSMAVLMLKLKLQYLATWCEELNHWKRPWCWERLKAWGEGENRRWDGLMASSTQRAWFEQTPGDSEGHGSLACCSPWGHKESDISQWWNNNNCYWEYLIRDYVIILCGCREDLSIRWAK